MPEGPDAESIKKLYYSISEVSEMLGVKPHVLRYWETQFGALRPKKSRAGNRMYRERDVEILRQIQELLHVRRYTIAGARRELSRLRTSGASVPVAEEHGDSDELRESDVDADALPESASNDDGARHPSAGRNTGALHGSAGNEADELAAEELPAEDEPAAEERTFAHDEPASSVGLPPANTSGERNSKDPLQTSLDVPRPTVPRAALTELREEIVRLQEWLEHRAKH